ncbi:MAG: peptidylprolyl isomerase [Myxococcales bacterium]|nr:peptidylprolyl isomerase [Myxococcales bacterium]
MSRLFRDPLLHFLLGGALLFGLYDLVGDGPESRDRVIVGEAEVERLATTFARTWMRPPTRAELDGLIDDFITEEILYREALELGLDRNDLVIRRRLRQKMEFLAQDLSNPTADDAALQAFLAENPDRFREPERWSFRQLFFDPARDGAARASERLAGLRADSDGEGDADGAAGDPTLLPRTLERASAREIDGTLGAGFAAQLAGAEVGEWSGPYASSFGLHLVFVRERTPGRLPALEEIRPLVERERSAAERRALKERFEQGIRERYEIEVQLPASAKPPS